MVVALDIGLLSKSVLKNYKKMGYNIVERKYGSSLIMPKVIEKKMINVVMTLKYRLEVL